MGEFEIKPLTPARWDAFAALVDKHNGVWGGCWCIYFHPDGPERGQGPEANCALKRRYVEEGKAHAALVSDDDVAIGWCEYGTPEELPSIYHRAQYEQEMDLLPDYRTTCFFIDRATAVEASRRQHSAAHSTSSPRPAAAWSRDTRGTPKARRSRRPTSTTGPAASTRKRGSSTYAARVSSTA